jgi:carbonic anhydrase
MNHPITRRAIYGSAIAALWGRRAWTQTHDANSISSADQGLTALSEGNRRFAAGRATHPHSSPSRIRETAQGQHPHAIVLTCSDSRVPPELLFDQGVGDLFVVRAAGNVANNDEIGSIEFAVEHFSPVLCIVLGHSLCGAVAAVVNGEQMSETITRMVAPIAKAVSKVRQRTNSADLLAESIRANVGQSIEDLQRGSPLVASRIRDAKLKLTGGIYKVEDGKVTWL